MNDVKRYSIGEAAAICHVTVQTLHHYDKKDIVKPAVKNEATGYRFYESEQLVIIQMIKNLKDMGFSLEEIKGLLAVKDVKYLTNQVQNRLSALKEEIRQQQTKYYSGNLFLERLQQGCSVLQHSMAFDVFDEKAVHIETVPAQDWIYIRRPRRNYHNEQVNIDRWTELLELVRKENVQEAGAINIVYHNPPLEQFYCSICDYEVCMPVKSISTDHRQYYRHEEAYLAATIYHIGAYDSLLQSYMPLMRWISENKYTVCGNIRDSFIISPIDTNNPDEYVTKIIAPICKE